MARCDTYWNGIKPNDTSAAALPPATNTVKRPEAVTVPSTGYFSIFRKISRFVLDIIEKALTISPALRYSINAYGCSALPDLTRKQVKILRDPVAVRDECVPADHMVRCVTGDIREDGDVR